MNLPAQLNLQKLSEIMSSMMIFVAPLLVYLIARTLLRGLPVSMSRPIIRAGIIAFFLFLFSAAGVLTGHVEYALHLPVAVSAVSMTLGLGIVLMLKSDEAPLPHARRWPLIFPPILVLMVSALSGEIDMIFACSLALTGVVSIYAIEEKFLPVGIDRIPVTRTTGERLRTIALFVPGTIGVLIAAMLAPEAIERTGSQLKAGSELLASSWLIAPAMVVPLLVESLPTTRKHPLEDDAGAIVRLPLLAIGFVLPLTWLLCLVDSQYISTASTQPTTQIVHHATKLFTTDMPSVILRVDGLILSAATLLIIPGALGVIRIARTEGICLIVMFLAYLFLSRMAGA